MQKKSEAPAVKVPLKVETLVAERPVRGGKRLLISRAQNSVVRRLE